MEQDLLESLEMKCVRQRGFEVRKEEVYEEFIVRGRPDADWSVVSSILLSFLMLGIASMAAAQNSGGTKETVQESKLPSGTSLPIVLVTSISFDKCKPGQALRGKVDKDVPLPNGAVIRKGSEVEGHVVEVTPAANGSGANVAMQ